MPRMPETFMRPFELRLMNSFLCNQVGLLYLYIQNELNSR